MFLTDRSHTSDCVASYPAYTARESDGALDQLVVIGAKFSVHLC